MFNLKIKRRHKIQKKCLLQMDINEKIAKLKIIIQISFDVIEIIKNHYIIDKIDKNLNIIKLEIFEE